MTEMVELCRRTVLVARNSHLCDRSSGWRVHKLIITLHFRFVGAKKLKGRSDFFITTGGDNERKCVKMQQTHRRDDDAAFQR